MGIQGEPKPALRLQGPAHSPYENDIMSDRVYETIVQNLAQLERAVAAWSPEQQATVNAMRESQDALTREALQKLLEALCTTEAGAAALRNVASDSFVRGLLERYDLQGKAVPPLKRPHKLSITERVDAALDRIRPMLTEQGCDVVRTEVSDPGEINVQLKGACAACASGTTDLRLLVQAELAAAAPDATAIRVTPQSSRLQSLHGSCDVSKIKPRTDAYVDVGSYQSLARHGVTAIDLPDVPLLVSILNGHARAYENACPHMGMPLDMGQVRHGFLSCENHGFQFDLESGQCLTSPDMRLRAFPTKVENDRVLVRLRGAS